MAPSDVAIGADLTLDALRLVLAPAVAEAAVFDGWTREAVINAAEAAGADPAVAVLAFKRDATAIQPMTLIDAWIASVDARMAEALPAAALATLPIRERIRRLVQFRLDSLVGQEEALRRALSLMALPTNVPRTLRLGWNSADAMWRLAGDTAVDYNHYTKRATLAALYASTLAVFAYDDSPGHAETRAFLARRIDGVMRFEKTKAALLRSDGERFSPARLLGRLRYPAR
ncbi:MAG: COQ9 family protein [Novosphingobium sp.]